MGGIVIRTDQQRCPFCKARVDAASAHRVCQRCLARHHDDCWDSYGRCGVFGCGSQQYLSPQSATPTATGVVEPVASADPQLRPAERRPAGVLLPIFLLIVLLGVAGGILSRGCVP